MGITEMSDMLRRLTEAEEDRKDEVLDKEDSNEVEDSNDESETESAETSEGNVTETETPAEPTDSSETELTQNETPVGTTGEPILDTDTQFAPTGEPINSIVDVANQTEDAVSEDVPKNADEVLEQKANDISNSNGQIVLSGKQIKSLVKQLNQLDPETKKQVLDTIFSTAHMQKKKDALLIGCNRSNPLKNKISSMDNDSLKELVLRLKSDKEINDLKDTADLQQSQDNNEVLKELIQVQNESSSIVEFIQKQDANTKADILRIIYGDDLEKQKKILGDICMNIKGLENVSQLSDEDFSTFLESVQNNAEMDALSQNIIGDELAAKEAEEKKKEEMISVFKESVDAYIEEAFNEELESANFGINYASFVESEALKSNKFISQMLNFEVIKQLAADETKANSPVVFDESILRNKAYIKDPRAKLLFEYIEEAKENKIKANNGQKAQDEAAKKRQDIKEFIEKLMEKDFATTRRIGNVKIGEVVTAIANDIKNNPESPFGYMKNAQGRISDEALKEIQDVYKECFNEQKDKPEVILDEIQRKYEKINKALEELENSKEMKEFKKKAPYKGIFNTLGKTIRGVSLLIAGAAMVAQFCIPGAEIFTKPTAKGLKGVRVLSQLMINKGQPVKRNGRVVRPSDYKAVDARSVSTI